MNEELDKLEAFVVGFIESCPYAVCVDSVDRTDASVVVQWQSVADTVHKLELSIGEISRIEKSHPGAPGVRKAQELVAEKMGVLVAMKAGREAPSPGAKESWRPSLSCDGYEVSSLGRIKSLDRKIKDGRQYAGKLLKPFSSGSGYLAVKLPTREGRQNHYLHRLVAEAFLGLSGGLCVNHRNGIKWDNRIENLEVVTQSENLVHSYSELGRVSRPPRGESHFNAKLTGGDIPEIRRRVETGESAVSIAEDYGVGPEAIRRAASGKSWRSGK